MSQSPSVKKLIWGDEGGQGGPFWDNLGDGAGVGIWQRNQKLWGVLALVSYNTLPPTKKKGFGGSGGVGGCILGTFSHTFGAIFKPLV